MEKYMKALVEDDHLEEVAVASLNTLPEEVIEMIFSFLNDPKDLMSVSNTALPFARIVNPRKPVFMFEEVFPLIFADLDRNDIYNCRLVCKQWNRSVDSYLQNIPESRYVEPYPYPFTKVASSSNPSPVQKAILRKNPLHRPVHQPLLRSKELYSIRFDNTGNLSNFLQKTSSCLGNPFLLRRITLNCEGVRGREIHAYWRQTTGSLLAKFGQEVYQLSFSPTGGRVPEHDIFLYYRRLRRTLQRLPNLKTLDLYRHNRYIPPVSSQLATRIQDYMDIQPLPPLPHLETISVVFLVILPREPVINELMRSYSSQLKTISISLSIWQDDIPEFSNLPECTSLYICVDDNLDKWKRVCRKLDVPNLGKLSLNVQMSWGISQVLQPLQQPNFQSLVYLKLRFICKLGRDRWGKKPGNQFLLEQVKTLEVYENSYVPYDFVLGHLPNLEYMLVCFDPLMDDLKEEVSLEDGQFEIRKWMFSNAMYQSNIWGRLEHLREFVFAKLGITGDTENEIASKVIYTRSDYNRLTEVKNRSGDGDDLEE